MIPEEDISVVDIYIFYQLNFMGKKKEKEQHEDKFKILNVTAISKLVNKCIEPFAIKILMFIPYCVRKKIALL